MSRHLDIFCLLVLLLNLLILLCLSLSEKSTYKSILIIRGGKKKSIRPHQEKARHEERMKQGKVIVQAKLVVGYWELIPMESGAVLLDPQDTATVRVTK